MNVEMTRYEAEVLIAVIVFAEGAADALDPAMTEAIKVLRPWRSALVGAYLRATAAEHQANPAIGKSVEPAQAIGSANEEN